MNKVSSTPPETMGNRKSRTRGRTRNDFESSMIDGNLRLTATESTGRVGKTQYDVVVNQREINSLLFGRQGSEVCRIMVLGKSCVGKSTVINGLSGAEIAAESHARQVGQGVEVYKLSTFGKVLLLVECPGLFSGDDREEGHVNDMKGTFRLDSTPCFFYDLVLFCFPITTIELANADRSSIDIFTSTFGKGIWSKTIIVLTFANKIACPSLSPVQFAGEIQGKLEMCSSWIKEVLISVGIEEDIVKSIPVVPSGYKETILPDGTDWVYELWQKMVLRVDQGLKSTLDCFENERFVPFGYVSIDDIPNQQLVDTVNMTQ